MLSQESPFYESNSCSSDPSILVEADGQDSCNQTLKKIAFPILDDDAIPSSIAVKVLTCIGKWEVKLAAMVQTVADAERPSQTPEEAEGPAAPSQTLQPLCQLLTLNTVYCCVYVKCCRSPHLKRNELS